MIHGDKSPIGKTLREFQDNLARTCADVERAALLAPADERERVFDKRCVNAVEMLLRCGGSVGFDFAVIVHHFRLGDTREV